MPKGTRDTQASFNYFKKRCMKVIARQKIRSNLVQTLRVFSNVHNLGLPKIHEDSLNVSDAEIECGQITQFPSNGRRDGQEPVHTTVTSKVVSIALHS